MKQINPPQIGLSLGGGVVRAVAHLGVLDIFHRAGIPIGVIAGTSGGSLVGAFYASQKFQISTLIDMVSNLGWWNWVRPGWSREGLMDSDKIGQFVVDRLGPLAFQDLSIPFAAVACNLANGFKVVLTQGPLAPAVQASCSLPVVFTPTHHNGQRLVDGGYVSQIPVLAAKQDLRADRVVGVDVNFRASETAKPPKNLVGIAIHMAALWARKNAEEEIRHADAIVRVDARGIGLTDFSKVPEMINRGRAAGEEVLPILTRWLQV